MKPDDEKSFLDKAADSLFEIQQRGLERTDASKFRKISFASDDSVGDFPQVTEISEPGNFSNDGGHYYDRVPVANRNPLQFQLKETAKPTDVLSSSPFRQGFLLSPNAAAVFSKFNLGPSPQFDAEVNNNGDVVQYKYLFVADHHSGESIDYSNSEFRVAEMLGPPGEPIEIGSLDDLFAKRKMAREGVIGSEPLSKIVLSKLVFKSLPTTAFFGLGVVDINMYVTNELAEAILDAKLTGLKLSENLKIHH